MLEVISDLKNRAVLCLICALNALSYTIVSAEGQAASITKNDVINSNFPLPGMQSGFENIQFRNGANKEKSASIQEIAIGELDGKPASVAFVAWSTGGTGVWEVLALYRLVKGKPQCIGLYDLEDRAEVKHIRIRNNQILLDWMKHRDSDPASMPSLHAVTKLKAKDFSAPRK